MKYKDKSNWMECAAKNCRHFISSSRWNLHEKLCGWYISVENPNRSRNAKLRPCHLIGKCPMEKGGQNVGKT